ncbi:MAG: twin-arginine translocation signal domain-containing protein [Verrucomicrobia bacterium]|jgi:anaerobic selenocysteine-containing dehydrogenase|nr:twin-arginine translocation signal domain-containing protein [Verrucomicrobiota bacterium]
MKLWPHGYSRRTFLKSSSAVAGGLTLGGFVWPTFAEVAAKSPALTVADLPKGAAPKPVP